MTSKTNQLASSGAQVWARTDDSLLDSLRFTAVCPACKDVRFQQGYGFRTVVRLLVDSQPIEAYCAVCNEHWQITADERAELAWLILTE